jgi:hypothetical protein
MQLDYTPKETIAGYSRFEGSCQTFPYNLQYPEGWVMEAPRGVEIGKTRTDHTRFLIRIGADQGSVHAAHLEGSLMARVHERWVISRSVVRT